MSFITDSNKAAVKKSIAIYGLSNQLYVAIEELSELQKEICKALREVRPDNNRENILEELADTYIVMENIKEIYRIRDEEIKLLVDYKLGRLENRMKVME